MARKKSTGKSTLSSAALGFEAKVWLTADKLRNVLTDKVRSAASD